MPLPLIPLIPLVLGAAGGAAALKGIWDGICGLWDMKNANDKMKSANDQHKKNIFRFEKRKDIATANMDNLGKKELEVLESFGRFSQVMEKIHNKPEFKEYNKGKVHIPKYNPEELKEVSVFAGVLLGGIGGAVVGTAGGYAASGATTAVIMALGKASTGIAIASLKGIAATKATLALIGGGTLAAGGGGIALGTTILSVATFGVGILIGGVIFGLAGASLSKKADEALEQIKEAERTIDKICQYLQELSSSAVKFEKTISLVNKAYVVRLNKLIDIVENGRKTDWSLFSAGEKIILENTVLLVALLYNMCKVQIVLPSGNATEPNKVDVATVDSWISKSKASLKEIEAI